MRRFRSRQCRQQQRLRKHWRAFVTMVVAGWAALLVYRPAAAALEPTPTA